MYAFNCYVYVVCGFLHVSFIFGSFSDFVGNELETRGTFWTVWNDARDVAFCMTNVIHAGWPQVWKTGKCQGILQLLGISVKIREMSGKNVVGENW